ncbi:MAG: hypothetical protein ABSH01_07100 [Terriglobia bacterium]
MRSRSGSQRRRTTKRVKVNCTPAHHAALCTMAEAHGQSLSALTLNALLKIPLPRTRRAKAVDKLMMQFFAELARARDALKSSETELGKSGSNLNQIAHVLNTDRPPERIMNLLEATLQAHQEVIQEHNQAVRDLEELRTAGMNAIGLELTPGGDDGDE